MREDVREREKKGRKKMMKKWKGDQRQYNEPQWVENQMAIHAQVKGIPLGRGPRQKLGIERTKIHAF